MELAREHAAALECRDEAFAVRGVGGRPPVARRREPIAVGEVRVARLDRGAVAGLDAIPSELRRSHRVGLYSISCIVAKKLVAGLLRSVFTSQTIALALH